MMKKIILVLISVMTINVYAQEVSDSTPSEEFSDDLMVCINNEFINASKKIVENMFMEDIEEAIVSAKGKTAEEQQAIVQQVRGFINGKTLEMITPYVNQSEGPEGQISIEIIDQEIIAKFVAKCKILEPVFNSGVPKIDKEDIAYKSLLKDRTELEGQIKPDLDKIKALERTIALLNENIANIQKGIVVEVAKINEIDAYVQEKLVIPGKSSEEIEADVQVVLQSEESLEVMGEISELLVSKFTESLGIEVKVELGVSAPTETAENPVEEATSEEVSVESPVTEEDQQETAVWVPDFKH